MIHKNTGMKGLQLKMLFTKRQKKIFIKRTANIKLQIVTKLRNKDSLNAFTSMKKIWNTFCGLHSNQISVCCTASATNIQQNKTIGGYHFEYYCSNPPPEFQSTVPNNFKVFTGRTHYINLTRYAVTLCTLYDYMFHSKTATRCKKRN